MFRPDSDSENGNRIVTYDSDGVRQVHYDTISATSDSEALMYADVTTAGNISASGITNVDWLSNLTSIIATNVTDEDGNLYLGYNQLINVDGLSSLTSVGGYLLLDGNYLTNIDGLSSLTSVGTQLELNGNQLTNVDGLSSLTSVGGYLDLQNNQLTNIDGLSSLTSVGGRLRLHGNYLTNVDGLSSLTSIGGTLSLYPNYSFSNKFTSFNLPLLEQVDSIDTGNYIGGIFSSDIIYDDISEFFNRKFTNSNGNTTSGKYYLEQMGYAHLLIQEQTADCTQEAIATVVADIYNAAAEQFNT